MADRNRTAKKKKESVNGNDYELVIQQSAKSKLAQDQTKKKKKRT